MLQPVPLIIAFLSFRVVSCLHLHVQQPTQHGTAQQPSQNDTALESELELEPWRLKSIPVVPEISSDRTNNINLGHELTQQQVGSRGPVIQAMNKWNSRAHLQWGSMRCKLRVSNHNVQPSWHPKICSSALPKDTVNSAMYLTSIPTYYISCDNATANRWLEDFRSLSENFNIVKCVRGSDHNSVSMHATEPYEAFKVNVTAYNATNKTHPPWLALVPPGVIGATLSHLLSIKQAYEAGHDVALILESDASPGLAPWWTQSIEEFTESLPDDWETAQLQWTSVLDAEHAGWKKVSGSLKYSNAQQRFLPGSSWGAVAYLIHRRGMEKIISRMWNARQNKFDLSSMRKDCPVLTADDCLLNFSPMSPWSPGSSGPMITRNYMAVPPMFTSYDHDSSIQTMSQIFVLKSYCDDINAALYANNRTCGGSSLKATPFWMKKKTEDKPKWAQR